MLPRAPARLPILPAVRKPPNRSSGQARFQAAPRPAANSSPRRSGPRDRGASCAGRRSQSPARKRPSPAQKAVAARRSNRRRKLPSQFVGGPPAAVLSRDRWGCGSRVPARQPADPIRSAPQLRTAKRAPRRAARPASRAPARAGRARCYGRHVPPPKSAARFPHADSAVKQRHCRAERSNPVPGALPTRASQ